MNACIHVHKNSSYKHDCFSILSTSRQNQRNGEEFLPNLSWNKPRKNVAILTEKKPEGKEIEIEEKEALTCRLHHGTDTGRGDTSERR